MILSVNGYLLRRQLPASFLQQFRKTFKNTELFHEMQLYRKVGDFYVFTRNSNIVLLLEQLTKEPVNVVHRNIHQETFPITLDYELYPVQLPVYHSILSRLQQKKACYFKLATGSGKTYIIAKVVETLQKKPIIIAHNHICLLEWKKIFNSNATYSTTTYALKHPEIFKTASITILDEVHNFCTMKRYELFWHCNTEYLIGCTASPERNDFMHIYLEYFIDPLIDLNQEMFKYNVTATQIFSDDRYCMERVPKSFHEFYYQIEGNTRRTQYIHDIVIKHSTLTVIIFVEHLSHIEKLKEAFHDVSQEIIVLTSKKSIPDKPAVILTTYKMASEGLSIPAIKVLILATPRKTHVDQVVGRLFRDKTLDARYVYDIVDRYFPFWINQGNIRRKYYTTCGFTIKYSSL